MDEALQKQRRKVLDSLPGDTRLRGLTLLTHDTDIRVGVTLTVKGLIITGVISSGREYSEWFTRSLREADDPNTETEVQENLRRYDEFFPKIGDDEPFIREIIEDYTRYIHLSDAQIISANGPSIPTHKGHWWRGLLDSVDGWMLGSLDVS